MSSLATKGIDCEVIASSLQQAQRSFAAARSGGGLLNHLSPLPKVVWLLAFLVVTVSIGRLQWGCALFFAGVPLALAWTGYIAVGVLMRRACVALPFVLFAGVADCFFDYPRGWIALTVLLLKTWATVGTVLVVVSTLSISALTGALHRLHFPCLLVMQIQFLLRYVELVITEAGNLVVAYTVRSGRRMIPVRDWGELMGRLFLRSVDHATSIYHAMQCRLFHAGRGLQKSSPGSILEWFWVSFSLLVLVAMRCFL